MRGENRGSSGRAAQSNITLALSDMRELRLPNTYSMAIIPARSYIFLTTVHDQEATLRGIHKHLHKNGLLVIDVFDPDPAILAEPVGRVNHAIFQEPAGRCTVERRVTLLAHDRVAQTRDERFDYEVRHADGRVEAFGMDWRMRYSYPYELQHLLRLCGYRIEAVYGGYDEAPFSEPGGRLIVAARKPA